MDAQKIYTQLSNSLIDLKRRKDRLTLDDICAEVINNACLDILRARKSSVNNKATEEEVHIRVAYLACAQTIIPEFEGKYLMTADFGIVQNLEWEEMWNHLRQYFKENHEISIDDVNSPSTNIYEIIGLSQVIHECQDLATLIHVYNQKGNYNHPQICADFGVGFLIFGDKLNAKKAFTQGAIYGIQYPCPLYDNALVDSVGQNLSNLMIKFPIADRTKALKLTALAYIYLSRCIELHPREAYDSYKTRGLLFKNHENVTSVVQSLIWENVGMSILIDPYIISDFYFASQTTNSPHQGLLQDARRQHQYLEDIAIGGRDADEYSLDEMALFGEKRHLLLFKTLEQKYKNGEFNLTIEGLNSSNR